jgi:peptidoglycan-associated lipoprotein
MIARKTVFASAAAVLAVAACHHAPPALPPAPEQASTPTRTSEAGANDSLRRAQAAADSLRLAREAAARDVASARATLLRQIYFDFDSASLRSDQQSTAEAKVPILTGNRGLSTRIEGNTDERGSAEYNIALGMRRAAEMKRFLTERGVDGSRIQTVSFGEQRPVCTQHDESCWQQNRRDEFQITAGEVGTHPSISSR